MKPKTKSESIWRMFGFEVRRRWQQGAGAAKTGRNFTRKQCNKAMRAHGRQQIKEQLM